MSRAWLALQAICIPIFTGVALTIWAVAVSAAPAEAGPGVKISYRLPISGPLPQTYRVTLAITSIDDPHWIVSTFLAGAVRTVTAENKGVFTESWNGLDDNFMPVPAGSYRVKGIYMPARRWAITGEFHTLMPKLSVAAGDSWFPKPNEDTEKPWIKGAAFGSWADVAIGKNGQAAFLHDNLENADNPYLVDLTKPIGHDQVVRAYMSSGTGGGEAVATDGEVVWAASPQGRHGDIIYRADGAAFGNDNGQYRAGVFAASGHVTSLAVWRNPATGARVLFAAQRNAAAGLLVLDGDKGALLKEAPFREARAVAVQGDALFLLHQDDEGKWIIERATLKDGLPSGDWQSWLELDGIADPTDFKVDAQSRTFVTDEPGNQVYELDAKGRVLRRFGHAVDQRPGHYDDHVFMSPAKLALWTDAQGQERLIVIERAGPGRISEWSEDGSLLRQWFSGQFAANGSYAVDPADPDHLYIRSNAGSGVTRFRVNYQTGAWAADAVWPEIAKPNACPGGSAYPRIINAYGRKFLGFALTYGNNEPCGYMLYQLEGDRWLPSAGLVGPPDANGVKISTFSWWNDADGDGKIEEAEYKDRPAKLPTRMNPWGDKWLDDLSLVMLEPGGRRAWRLAPSGFDAHGNPIFDGSRWTELLVDPIAQALTEGNSDPRRGGNELPPGGDSYWMDVEGSVDKGFIVAASTGPNWPDGIDSSGRIGSQMKISRYLPDGSGGYRLVWRAGRKAFTLAQPGEAYSALRVSGPFNGLIAVEDGNGLVHIFTDEGLYVDTLFFDVYFDLYRGKQPEGGVYALSGELFNGYAFLNEHNDKVYVAIGRDAATLYEVAGWTGSGRIVSPITTLSPEITLTAGDTAPAPYFALRIRGASAPQHVLELQPAPGGGPALDGSPDGWDSAAPIAFGLDNDRKADIQAMYDPTTLYLRLHLRLPRPPLPADAGALDRIFTDAAGADTMSFYVQGDPAAQGTSIDGRPGDAQFVCALVKDQNGFRPIVVGMYPSWNGSGPAHPVSYASAVGHVAFAHLGIVDGARAGYRLDEDGKGFTIAAAIPRDAVPGLPPLGAGGVLHTTVDFAATLAGKTKFWWSNTDGSASTVTSDVPSEARLYPGAWGHAQFAPLGDFLAARSWLVSGPWGGPGRAAIPDAGPQGDLARWQLDVLKLFRTAHYPPDDQHIDPDAVYDGPLSEDERGVPHRISWKIARSRPEDDQLRLGDAGRIFFAAQWIWSPDAREVEAEVLHFSHNAVSGWLNGSELVRPPSSGAAMEIRAPVSPQKIALRAGWNLLLLRAMTTGYDLRLGLRLHDTPARLWQLRLAPLPPGR